MKPVFLKARWKWLRLVLAMLLPLHTGFAQAAMTMPTPAAGIAVDAALMPDGMPCHHQAKASPAPDPSSGNKGNCCDAGSCHCVAACGLSFTIARIAPQPGSVVSPFTYLSVTAVARPPDLRPPIA